MYEYEPIKIDNDIDYEIKLNKLENLCDNLKIDENALSLYMKNSIYDSVAIEGNSLKREEVERVLDEQITIRGKSLSEMLQVKNLNFALDSIKEVVSKNEDVINIDSILMLHKIVTEGEVDAKECGVFRMEPVHIKYTDYIPPLEIEVPEYMQELCDMYHRPLDGQNKFERICEFKRNFERIHPFIDGNGRTGRLLFNILLLQNGYGFAHFPFDERDLYFMSLENNTFHKYIIDKVIEGTKQININRQMEKENGRNI